MEMGGGGGGLKLFARKGGKSKGGAALSRNRGFPCYTDGFFEILLDAP